MIKVLIVDDSPVINYILSSDPELIVLETAGNGIKALEMLALKKPDVIIMNIDLHKLKCLELIRRVMETKPVPIIVISSYYEPGEVDMTVRAIDAGAVAVVEKPLEPGCSGFEETAGKIIQTIKTMAEVKLVKRWRQPIQEESDKILTESYPKIKHGDIKAVAIGASTGGPVAILKILKGLCENFPVPVLIVQHITSGFLPGLIDWCRQTVKLPVQIAVHGEYPLPGHVYFAADDYHMGLAHNGRIVLTKDKPENGVRPSVSYLFRSIAEVFGKASVGILLTGMGKDGAQELKLMKQKGAVTIAQNKASSVVYGMPGEAVKIGAATNVQSPELIALTLNRLVRECHDQ